MLGNFEERRSPSTYLSINLIVSANIDIRLLISVDRALISVDSASKKAYYFLDIFECFLISVIHTFIGAIATLLIQFMSKIPQSPERDR
ncbi:MAG: hypothetical protein IGS49_11130 [Chlorogloeopsis fritschii C42_A2020_084]|jgi:hypothetical protein|uniref:hypothetical protein n=1 Tax=Chlorogloeopsis fritschii TaxID=1124 RepID=UPI0019EA6E97|nr:hypothetical protein [Chlorogloeopsis fritschii]MBF2005990.1 hypothetical protein [Chlorogloeopsis fritschii C42_A2020_084]